MSALVLRDTVPVAPTEVPTCDDSTAISWAGAVSTKTPEKSSAPRLQVDEERLVKTFKRVT